MTNLVRPLPVVEVGLDDIIVQIPIELPTNHGLSAGDHLELAIGEVEGLPAIIRLRGELVAIGQNGAGRLVGLQPLILTIQSLRPANVVLSAEDARSLGQLRGAPG